MKTYTIPLSAIMNEFSLQSVYLPTNAEEILISRPEVHRCGLALSGFFRQFEPQRIQLIGNAEWEYMTSLDKETRKKNIDSFLSHHPTAVIFAGLHDAPEEFLELAKKHQVPILRAATKTTDFMAALIASLNVHLAPRITRHGVLVEVYGEGILIIGSSGIGKSETAIELLKRGHRLIADDAVEIKKVSAKSLVGSAPSTIRYYAELRGVGIVDVRRIFGIGAVKETEKINMVVILEPWDPDKYYDRLGLENEYYEIMDIKVPMVTIPVRPGRNLAIIMEIAAMNNRQKRMGYNTAEEFNKMLLKEAGIES
ncbi:MAG: HPr(Ser) kinase/phosphatase [Ruminococcaceae bacterium]|nr:HPr(Ser) kinase/phosphatase [Oscillospiraceae bacterium]